jgi:hypothetical protein
MKLSSHASAILAANHRLVLIPEAGSCAAHYVLELEALVENAHVKAATATTVEEVAFLPGVRTAVADHVFRAPDLPSCRPIGPEDL